MKKLLLTIAALVTMSSSAFAQLGSADKDLVYTPVTPCRVLDTRTSQGGTGAIAADGTKHFKIWGQTSFAAQGGKNSDCGLTAGSHIAAVAMNFTVVTPAAGGFITAHPFGVARPTAATVNFQVGDIARGDFSIAKVTQTGTAATNHLSIYSTSLADVVGDVVGYYSKPVSLGSLECVEVSSASVAVDLGPFSGRYYNFAYAPNCAAGYTSVATRCGTLNALLSTSNTDSDGECAGQSNEASYFMKAIRKCCRIPGR